MNDFIVDGKPFETPIGAANEGYANTSPSLGEAFESMFEESSPVLALTRAANRGQFSGASIFDRAMYETLTTDPNTGLPIDPNAPTAGSVETPVLDADEANKLYAPEGTKITDRPIPEGIAQMVGQEKSRQIEREAVIARFQNNHGFLNNFAVGTAAFLMDPLNLATAFVPALGEEAALAGVARVGLRGIVGRTVARAASGALTGAALQAPLSALKYGLSDEDASGYDLKSAFRDLFYSAAGGAVLTAGFGAAGDVLGKRGAVEPPKPADVIPAADAPTKHAAMGTAISQVLEGRPVDVLPIFNERDVKLLSEEAGLKSRDEDLSQQLGGLNTEGAEAARDTLSRLDAVNAQLADETISASERKTLLSRRDELLTDTTPEALREAAAPLEQQRVMESERSFIAQRLSEIQAQRTSQQAEIALSTLPRLPEAQRAVYDNGFAPGIPQGEFEQTFNAIYNKAAEEPIAEAPKPEAGAPSEEPRSPIDGQIADLEASMKEMAESGLTIHPEDMAEISASEKEVGKAELLFDTFKAAAMCLKGLL